MGLKITDTLTGKEVDIPELSMIIASELQGWMSKQVCNGEGLLHVAVCCDFVGVHKLKLSLAERIEERLSQFRLEEIDDRKEEIHKG